MRTPWPIVDGSFDGTLIVSVTTSPWFTEKVEGLKLNERAVIEMAFAASGLIASGCGMTAPCSDIACIIIFRCSRCSELSSANAPKASRVSAITNPPILRMVTRRFLPIFCLQFDDDVAAVENGEDPQPQCNEAQPPEQRREFRRKE